MKSPKWFNVVVLAVMLLAALPAQAAPPDPLTRARSNSPVPAQEVDESEPLISAPLPPRDADAVQIRLQQAVFDPLQTTPQLEQTLTQTAYAGDGTGYYLVQFHGPILSEWKTALVDAGAVLYEYVPDFAFVVKMNAAVAQQVEALEIVRWVGLYQPAFRLSNALLPTVQKADPEKMLQIVVRSFTSEPTATLAKDLTGLGATILAQGADTGGGTIFQLELPATAVANVARLLGVAWVEPKSTPRLANAVSRSSAAMNKDAVENTLGLYGENQIVVVGDTGFSTGDTATMHPDFRGHFYQGSWGGGTCGTWADANGHGTHVAGSVLGSGVMDGAVTTTHSYSGTNAGIAPEALLWGWAFCSNWSGLPDSDPYNDYYGVMYTDDPRARVNTNSWSYDASAGTYNAFSRETDRFIWDHPDMVVLFAASNDGIDGDSDGIVDLDSMGVPAGSKNIITVGASENYRMSGGYNPGGACSTWGGCWPSDYPSDPINSDRLSDDPSGMVPFSSRGPVDDGRLKPDIVAPGSNIVSTRDDSTTGWGIYNDYYIYMGGTSMATPLTAGAAAIVREFYTDTYGIDPTAALVKATFINGAYDMTPGQYRDEVPDGSQDDVTRRPDFNQGWGRVDLATSLIYEAPRQLWFHEYSAGLATNGDYSVTVNTRYAESPFRVSLVWSDQAGTEASYGALVNDLDLVVESSTGSTYYGNDIVGDGLLDGDVDHTNNVEGIDLAPGIATYTITVKGYNVPNGPQPFALVVSGDMAGMGVLEGTVSDAGTGLGIANAQITATSVPTQSAAATTSLGDGTYQLNLTPGTYTVTVSAYGYVPQTATSVTIGDGVTTTQDFALTAAPNYVVSGTVTDANTGWALYAEINVDGYPGNPIYTDPVTGFYSVTLPDGGTYEFAATSMIDGYLPDAATVVLNGSDVTQNFALDVDAGACNAPGYEMIGLREGFEGAFLPAGWNLYETGNTNGPGWQQGTTGTSGSHGDPHGGTYYAWNNDDNLPAAAINWLVLPQFAVPTGGATLTFWQRDYYQTFYDYHGVWVTTGSSPDPSVSTYVEVWTGDTEESWVEQVVDLSAYAGQNIYLAFRYEGDNADEWYIDDVSLLGPCTSPTGGLLVGGVYDANTAGDLTGAEVSNSLGDVATAQATSGDAAVSDAFYAIYAPSGTQTFTATMPGYAAGYADDVVSSYPVQDGVTQAQDFFLDTGWLDISPLALTAWVRPGMLATRMLLIHNVGQLVADFEIFEISGGSATDVVADGSFEGGTPNADWNEASTNYGTPICTVADCGSGGGTGPHTGTYWAWFGGAEATETGSVDQDVVIPVGTATLSFWLEIPATDVPMTMSVYIDGGELFSVSQVDSSQYNPYSQVAIDVSAYADGGTHNLEFHSVEYGVTGSVSNIFVDDVILGVTPPIAWLDEDPVDGTLAPAAEQVIAATFDATSLAEGQYTGQLRVVDTTPYENVTVPVELNVSAGDLYTSATNGDWSALSSWEGAPSRPPAAVDDVVIAAGTEITADSSSECHNLTVEMGARLNLANSLNVYGTMTNSGQLHQEAVANNAMVDFGMLDDGLGNSKYYGVTLDASGVNLGLTSVDIYGSVISGTGNLSQTVGTWFDINPATPAPATLTVWYPASALNGNDSATTQVYHHVGGDTWEPLTTLDDGVMGDWYWLQAAATSFSPFVIKSPDAPTAVGGHGLAVVGGTSLAFVVGLIALGLLFTVPRRLSKKTRPPTR